MKNTLIILTAILTLSSCSNSIEDKIITFSKSEMKDPNSFDLIKLKKQDTTRKSDLIDITILTNHEDFMYSAQRAKEYTNLAEYQNSIYRGRYSDGFYVKMAKYWVGECQKIKKTNDSLLSIKNSIIDTPKDSIRYETWYLSCYANNTFGKRIIGEYNVVVFPDGKMKLSKI